MAANHRTIQQKVRDRLYVDYLKLIDGRNRLAHGDIEDLMYHYGLVKTTVIRIIKEEKKRRKTNGAT